MNVAGYKLMVRRHNVVNCCFINKEFNDSKTNDYLKLIPLSYKLLMLFWKTN